MYRNVPAAAAEVIPAIREHFGRIDVVEYGPISGDHRFIPATQVSASALGELIPLLLLSLVEVVQAVLPEWLDRGDGAFLLTQGATAAQAIPYFSGVGPVMAAAASLPDAASLSVFPVVDPADLAQLYWDLYTRRDLVEQIYPVPAA